MLRAYDLTEPDFTDAVRLLRSTFHGYSALEANGGFGAPRDVQASWQQCVEALHAVLERWPSAQRGGEGRANDERTSARTDCPEAPEAIHCKVSDAGPALRGVC